MVNRGCRFWERRHRTLCKAPPELLASSVGMRIVLTFSRLQGVFVEEDCAFAEVGHMEPPPHAIVLQVMYRLLSSDDVPELEQM